jgi:hypothetical protein
MDLRRLISHLIEDVPVAGAPEPPKQRLSRVGQLLLASGVGLLGLGTYLASCVFSSYIEARLLYCPTFNAKSLQTGSPETLTALKIGDATNLLTWNYRMNDELIRDLTGASRGQQLLLNQQNASLTMRLSRLCHLAQYYRIHVGGLGAVSTGAAVILVITGMIRMPKGIAEISRGEKAIFISSLSLLVLSVGYLSLGSVQEQAKANWQYHKMGIELLSEFRSSLANRQLLITQAPGSTVPSDKPAIPLSNPAAVAELVNRFERRLVAISHGSVKVDTSFSRQTYEKLLQQQQPPDNPLPSSP